MTRAAKFKAGDVVVGKNVPGLYWQILSVHWNSFPTPWYVARVVSGGRFNDVCALSTEPYYNYVRHAPLPTETL